jgi:phage terminase large subunit-like protein
VWDPNEWDGRIPRREVDAAVAEIMATFTVARFYCDPHLWETQIDEWSREFGEKVVVQWPTNRSRRMYEALVRFHEDLREGKTTHSYDPMAREHALHARKQALRNDTYVLGKPAVHMKIDILMADVLAHEAAADARATGWDPTPTNRGLIRFY